MSPPGRKGNTKDGDRLFGAERRTVGAPLGTSLNWIKFQMNRLKKGRRLRKLFRMRSHRERKEHGIWPGTVDGVSGED
jgi:hypothetical protein